MFYPAALTVGLVGIQGSGKDTLGLRLQNGLHATHLNMSDLLRRRSGRLGEEIRQTMAAGRLVADELVCQCMDPEIINASRAHLLVLNGFARSVKQFEAMYRLCERARRRLVIIELQLDRQTAFDRVIARAKTEKRLDDTPKKIERRQGDYLRHWPAIKRRASELLVDWCTIGIEGLTPDQVAWKVGFNLLGYCQLPAGVQ